MIILSPRIISNPRLEYTRTDPDRVLRQQILSVTNKKMGSVGLPARQERHAPHLLKACIRACTHHGGKQDHVMRNSMIEFYAHYKFIE